jgi:uncharacterized membrane protein
MTRQAYLAELRRLLRKLPADDVEDILRDYDEHIRLARGSGLADAQVFQRLGDPRTVAKAIMAEFFLDAADSSRQPRALLRATLASMSLGVLNAVLVVPPMAAGVVVMGVLAVMAVAMIAAPVVAVYGAAQGYGVTLVAASLLVTGIGLFLLAGIAWLWTRIISPGVLRYLRFNMRVARGARVGRVAKEGVSL